jgi:hypothetical protein
MARSCRHLGCLDAATELLAAAQAMAEQLGIPGGPADVASRERATNRLRELMGEKAFESAWEAGRALSFDAAVTLAAETAAATEPSRTATQNHL